MSKERFRTLLIANPAERGWFLIQQETGKEVKLNNSIKVDGKSGEVTTTEPSTAGGNCE